jgi:apolipoprotein N-acyltransferase
MLPTARGRRLASRHVTLSRSRWLPRPSRHGLIALLGGILVAASLPPWGFWPLAVVGIAVFETALNAADNGRQRLTRGWLFGLGWLAPGMVWMWFLTAPGYVVASLLFAVFHGVAAWAAPRGPWRVVGRPAAHTLAECLRFVFPFGGVPLASLAIGQAGGPFLGIARIGGVIVLTWFTFQLGFALAGPSPVVPQLAKKRGATARGEWHGVIMLGVLVLVYVLNGTATGDAGGTSSSGLPYNVAAVQGGGPQGTHAIDTDPRVVFDRHLKATQSIKAGTVNLVVWPENVVDVPKFEGSPELAAIATEAKRLAAPILVGVTEDVPGDHFTNAQVVVMPDGSIADRYDKVHRVPFGEYMPMRGFLHALGAPTDLVPRDAIAGVGPSVLHVPDGPTIAVAISWEVFFGERVRDGISHGGWFIINPTNGSSYTWTVLQSQQIAASRLRAVEEHQWLVQVAPTGFSAFVTADGDVHQRTRISEQKVIIEPRQLTLPTATWYHATGDLFWTVVMALLLLGAWFVPGRAWRATRQAATAPAAEAAAAQAPTPNQ